MDEERTCLDCGDPLKGRSDKKFCSDQCKNNFNNRLNKDETNFIRNVQNMLRKNRRILAELNPDGQAIVHRDQLQAKGYNFTFHTNTYVSNSGETYYFCYEQGFLPIEDNYFKLVLTEEYIK